MTTSATDRLRDIYRRYATDGDTQELFAMLAEDVRWISSPESPLGEFAGIYTGPEEVRRYFERLRREWTLEAFNVLDFIADGEKVAVRTQACVRHNESGESVEATKADFITLRDGCIAEFQEIIDNGPVARWMRHSGRG